MLKTGAVGLCLLLLIALAANLVLSQNDGSSATGIKNEQEKKTESFEGSTDVDATGNKIDQSKDETTKPQKPDTGESGSTDKNALKIARIGASVCPEPLSIAVEWERPPQGIQFTILGCQGERCIPSKKISDTQDTKFVYRNLKQDSLYRFVVATTTAAGVERRSEIREMRTPNCRINKTGAKGQNGIISGNSTGEVANIQNKQINSSDAPSIASNNSATINTDEKEVPKAKSETAVRKSEILRSQLIQKEEIRKKIVQVDEPQVLRENIREISKEKIKQLREQPQKRIQVEKTREQKEHVISKIAGATLAKKLRQDKIQNKESISEAPVEIEVLDEDITEEVDELTAGIEAAKNTPVEKVANVIEEVDEQGNKESITLITMTIVPPKNFESFRVYEEIPKEIAKSAQELIFYDDNVEIVEDDPLITWHFTAVPEELELTYGVGAVINDEILDETVTIPVANNPKQAPVEDSQDQVKESEEEIAPLVEQPGEVEKKSPWKFIVSAGLLLFVILTVLVSKMIASNVQSPPQQNTVQPRNQIPDPRLRQQQLYTQRMEYLRRKKAQEEFIEKRRKEREARAEMMRQLQEGKK